jgi:hydroxypyruvate reductase/glycerate 2-kinase
VIEPQSSRDRALSIWLAAVRSADPGWLLGRTLAEGLLPLLETAPRIIVVGAGKAGTSMALSFETAVPEYRDRLEGIVNVPEGTEVGLNRLRLHPARPQGQNEPTEAGVRGAEEMLRLLASAGPDDVAICLLSGGASALLPAPAEGITLRDKLETTRLFHQCGATINEMNCVRKHLSRVKGGRLAEAFRGKQLVSLIISDVVGDPLDVIGSGPTAPDPTTYADALAVIERFRLRERLPPSVVAILEQGASGQIPETPKSLPPNVDNRIIGSNRQSLDAAAVRARELGYSVLDLGAFVEGETREVAIAMAGLVRSIRRDQVPVAPPACILIGGETTVSMSQGAGRGGRNQEFVLAMLAKLAGTPEGLTGVTILSGGTDGEDGPTDAAGAIADAATLAKADRLGLSLEDHLHRHDAYPLFDTTGDLIRCGLTGTNVMDIRVVLVEVGAEV